MMTHEERVAELLWSTDDRTALCERITDLEEYARAMWGCAVGDCECESCSQWDGFGCHATDRARKLGVIE